MIKGVQLIIIKEGKLLIAKRAPFKQNGSKRIGANRWNLIGGKIDPGESAHIAANRETYEEAGVILDNLVEISSKVNTWDPEYDPFYAHLFITYLSSEDNILLNKEHSEYKFINIEDLDKYNLLGYTKKEIIEAIETYNLHKNLF